MQILSFVWDPSPGIDLGFFIIRYYSLMFVIAFSVGWLLTKKIYKNEGQPDDKLDSLFIYVVVATLVGARLGHVFFYQPELLKEDFFSVFLPFSFKNGFQFTGFRGLASHGAAIGIIIILKQIPHAIGYDSSFFGEEEFTQLNHENTFSSLLNAFSNFDYFSVLIFIVSIAIFRRRILPAIALTLTFAFTLAWTNTNN